MRQAKYDSFKIMQTIGGENLRLHHFPHHQVFILWIGMHGNY